LDLKRWQEGVKGLEGDNKGPTAINGEFADCAGVGGPKPFLEVGVEKAVAENLSRGASDVAL
jgi:hypothetical protein